MLKNTQLIFEFSFAIPGISAGINRLSSITNALWTDEKNRFLVEAIKVVVVTKTRFKEISCNDFYTLTSNNPKLVQEIRSSTKYKVFAQKEKTTHATLPGN
jgi:hypothetical protein